MDDFNARRRQRELAICVHFNGTLNDACRAGIKYADVEDRTGEMKGRKLPCLPPLGGGVCMALCEKRRFPTPAEVEAKEARILKSLSDTMTARAAIVEKIGPYVKRKTPGATGSIPCPICKTGTLHYSRASFNGHIHAACTTTDCTRWME